MNNNTKNLPMALIAVLAVAFVPVVCKAGTLERAGADDSRRCQNVPLKKFLNAQKATQNFFPPVFDYLGWTDHDFTTFALVDYAGLANEYIKNATGHSLGTQVKGSIVKCNLPNGDAQITVDLETTKALGFAQNIEDIIQPDGSLDFLNTDTIFGNKAQDVANGAAAATGEADLFATFVIKADNPVPLPSLVDALQNDIATYAPVTFKFKSKIAGKCANGKPGYLIVDQAGASDNQNAMVFSKEIVNVSCSEK